MQFVPHRGFANLPEAGKPLPATQIKRAAFFREVMAASGGGLFGAGLFPTSVTPFENNVGLF